MNQSIILVGKMKFTSKFPLFLNDYLTFQDHSKDYGLVDIVMKLEEFL